jgi:hypothetical protein
MNWQNIHNDELNAWQQRIYAACASLFQSPIWLQSFQNIGFFNPRFYKYENDQGFAYCGLLSMQIGIIKAAVISYGPVVDEMENVQEVLNELLRHLKKEGFSFVRISGALVDEVKKLKDHKLVSDTDSFPFYKDVLNHFIVHKKESKEALKTSFKQAAKNKINKVEKYDGYTFVIDDEGKYLDAVYELFIRKGNKNGFTYRPKENYKTLFENNAGLKFARFYLCFYGEVLVNAILIVRDKNYSMNMSGALDEDQIQENVSPAVYLHYYAMQHEFYEEGTKEYDMLYSDGAVGMFKRNFNPEHIIDNRMITVVFEPLKYKLYETFLLKYASTLKTIGRKAISFIKK